ncbi:hypothetical protein QBC36DRAFT_39947 [Triangularia setosa]|uniref:Secreted protein n=1 Tax=Triangularia setosa TaxID=2587417 RepID=A0AAN7AD70_9PEZI|nr:hypothetical protein QBC36DRAFT_39947 [Podospora setosa]
MCMTESWPCRAIAAIFFLLFLGRQILNLSVERQNTSPRPAVDASDHAVMICKHPFQDNLMRLGRLGGDQCLVSPCFLSSVGTVGEQVLARLGTDSSKACEPHTPWRHRTKGSSAGSGSISG